MHFLYFPFPNRCMLLAFLLPEKNKMANQSNSTFPIAPSIFNKEVVIVSCFFYVIIAFLAVFGNGLVIGSFIRYYRLRTITNYFVVSLAVADIIVGVISIPIWISILLYSSAEIGEVVNTVYNVLDLFAGTSSILHLVVISMERFFAVVYPIKHIYQSLQRLLDSRLGNSSGGLWVFDRVKEDKPRSKHVVSFHYIFCRSLVRDSVRVCKNLAHS